MRNKYADASDRSFYTSCRGDDFHLLYSPVVAADGSMKLEVSGKVDIQKEINSFRDTCDMAYILKRLGLGDTSVLSSGHMPAYGDFSRMPTNPAEFLQLAIDSEKAFYELPLDVRSQYGNDYRKWFADFGSDNWYNNMQSVFGDSADGPGVIHASEDVVQPVSDNNE